MCSTCTKAWGLMIKSNCSSSPLVSFARLRKTIRSPVTGFSISIIVVLSLLPRSRLQRLLRQIEREVDQGADGDAAGALHDDALLLVVEVDARHVEVHPGRGFDGLLLGKKGGGRG